jgi:hypothetical protein
MCALIPTWAQAHHVVSESGIAWVEPVSVVEVDAEASSFDLGPWRRGSWQSVAVTAQYAPLEWFSLSARLPVASVQYEDGRGAMGLADVEVGARIRLFETPHGGIIVSAGVGLELPTGDEATGLGGGHYELSPYVAMSTQPLDWLIVSTLVSARLSLLDDEDGHSGPPTAHGAVIAPHAPREVFTRVSAAWVRERALYVSAGLDAAWMIGAMDQSPWVARAEVGFLGVEGVRVALGVDQTIWGAARHGLKGRLSVAYIF